ncbi:MAG: MotA/TolQ/ExbB proton channel family protein [Cryomorphaceae bacterium]|nr:MAG: MotA/TolQ/ExbB proton channel family protein [Cryomorphaceae bacterium]
MKKLLSLLTLAGFLIFTPAYHSFAQDNTGEIELTEEEMAAQKEAEERAAAEAAQKEESRRAAEQAALEKAEEQASQDLSFHQEVKRLFIDGDPRFMSFVLVCLILGLALCIERIVYLNMSTTNTQKLLNNIESALQSGGVEAAKEVCRNTQGPVASIFYQGLDRSSEGIEMVEKSVVAYGGVQMGLLEKGLSWISLFIALAPMLGFMGTVIGMISAFDNIAAENNISPAIVAGGIKVALITTVSGLIVAIILQIFYNYILAKIDGIVNNMEDASIALVDMLIKHNIAKNG